MLMAITINIDVLMVTLMVMNFCINGYINGHTFNIMFIIGMK